jgi:hypothetical protein
LIKEKLSYVFNYFNDNKKKKKKHFLFDLHNFYNFFTTIHDPYICITLSLLKQPSQAMCYDPFMYYIYTKIKSQIFFIKNRFFILCKDSS